MRDEFDNNKFYELLPRLLKNKEFRKVVEDWLESEPAARIIDKFLNGETFTDNEYDKFYDAVHNAFREQAINVLTLGWDGNFPGSSGAIWLIGLDGVYIITDDFGDHGPYDNLEEALDFEAFFCVTSNPEVDSNVLPLEKLLEIAESVVDWENEGDVWVMGERYVVKGNELVLFG